MNAMNQAPRHRVAAPAGRAPFAPPRRLRAADQGPFDWLVPFIPPFLRVNRETREMIWASFVDATSPAAIQRSLSLAAAFVNEHRVAILKYGVASALWISGLLWVHRNEPEFTTTYVILSGFVALFVHSRADNGGNVDGDQLSAYSVFNKGGKRMMGSLSAEQFENEIRHRGPHHADEEDDQVVAGGAESEEEADPDLLEAIRQSLQEKKREERRMRRTR